jgi:hypothetical protein
MTLARKIWEWTTSLIPREGFFFDRPLLILHSDDWGRAGLRDREGFERLKAVGLALGERPYDLYTLETAADLRALSAVLGRHRDATGRPATLVMNFVVANLDIPQDPSINSMPCLLPLADGLPAGWVRPELMEAYREGIHAGLFYPALHGISHFCRPAVERYVRDFGERGALLQALWRAGTPYIYWRMPWIGYEYWDPEQPQDSRFLSRSAQKESIGQAVGLFARAFSCLPRSACAPGYRANDDTRRAWSECGIYCAQNGPSAPMPPHLDRHGVLQIYRNVEFEVAIDQRFSLESSLRAAEQSFSVGVPAVVSVHSINFHSTVRNFRSHTLQHLDEFLGTLKARHPDLLYVHDEDIHHMVQSGSYTSRAGLNRVNVERRRFRKPAMRRLEQE